MSEVPNIDLVSLRSFEVLETEHLRRLAVLALADLEELFARRPETSGLYHGRMLLLCLCQGAAEHFVRQKHGIKDLDVWIFFDEHPTRPFPYRRRGTRDFGRSSLGRHPADNGFAGRRVDLLGRSIRRLNDQTPVDAVRCWLRSGRSSSSKLIAQRPVVAIYPENHVGHIIWDPFIDIDGTANA